MVSFSGAERVPRTKDLDDQLRGGMTDRFEAMLEADRLTPWDIGMRIESHPVISRDIPGAYPIVRWTDRWSTQWQHEKGTVRKITKDDLWVSRTTPTGGPNQ
jgi:hypothetical protein